jgi:tetratricopeptide (TPR) repeat protein
MPKLFYNLIFLALSWPALANSNAEELLTKANQAYLEEQYSHAAEIYEEIKSLNLESVNLYYNLANSYFKDGKYGKAILNYERALRLSPGHENAGFNLQVAQSRIVDKVTPVPTVFYVMWWRWFYSIFSINNWGWMVIFSLVFALVCLGLYFFGSSRKTKMLAFGGAIAFFALMLVSNLAARSQYYNNHQRLEGIILMPRVAAKSSPSETSPELFVVHEGSKGLITNDLNEWIEIRLANGNVGWVKKTSLEVI